MSRRRVSILLLALASCHPRGPRRAEEGAAALTQLERLKADVTRALPEPSQAALDRNDFVIVPGTRAPSFHFGYSALFEKDQPVYVTADAVLHAVHASFDETLVVLEEQLLVDELGAYIDALRDELPTHTRSSPQARADLDLILTVAKRLLRGTVDAPVAGASADEVANFVGRAEAAAGFEEIEWQGETVPIDFSMMKPRGHYTRNEVLARYFRAFSWLARMEQRIGWDHDDGRGWQINRRALASALLLSELWPRGAGERWARLDHAMELLVGPRDSMPPTRLAEVFGEVGLRWDNVATLDTATLVEVLLPEAQQRINTQMVKEGHRTIPLWLMAQRYIADSHVLTETSYGVLPDKRMMPSTLDVAAAIFDNPQAHQLLTPDYAEFPSLRPAVEHIHTELDGMGSALWQGSMSHLWLGALRSLSPQDRVGMPAFMATPSWDLRILNTQLASWAERRHDIILYAKPSATAIAGCSFPQAYVDPYPEFFARLRALMERGAALADELGLPPSTGVEAYYTRAASILGQLRDIAAAEREGRPLTPEDLDFINHMVSIHGERVGSGSDVAYTIGGWLAELYYDTESGKFHRPTIVDVHTQPSDEVGEIVGRVLHAGVDRPQLIEVVIDGVHYRGFVSSYREIVTEDFERLDDEWMAVAASKGTLQQVDWLDPIAPGP